MYTIIVEGKNRKRIAKLEPIMRQRVIAAIDALAENPRPAGKQIKHFTGIAKGYRLRVGSFRVIYAVNDAQKEVRVIDVGYRGDIY